MAQEVEPEFEAVAEPEQVSALAERHKEQKEEPQQSTEESPAEEKAEVEWEEFFADQYDDYLHFHGLAVEGAEALAEYWHKRMRQQLGIAADDAPEIDELFKQKYQGSRYSFGYPACPNLEDQGKLLQLLDGARIGVSLSEEFQLEPEQSTSAVICHHPAAKYFNVSVTT